MLFLFLSVVFISITLDHEFLIPGFLECLQHKNTRDLDASYCQMINDELTEITVSYLAILGITEFVLLLAYKASKVVTK